MSRVADVWKIALGIALGLTIFVGGGIVGVALLLDGGGDDSPTERPAVPVEREPYSPRLEPEALDRAIDRGQVRERRQARQQQRRLDAEERAYDECVASGRLDCSYGD